MECGGVVVGYWWLGLMALWDLNGCYNALRSKWRLHFRNYRGLGGSN
jgi:hypothetical protein